MNNKVVLYVLYAIIIIALGYLVYATKGFGIWKNAGTNKDQYQAIFLTNGQVYFGKVDSMDAKKTTLSDIYYLQVQQVQPATESTTAEQKLTLIKLGNELHGPEDKMYINSDQVLFYENLKDEGKVVQAIKKYQAEGPSAETSAQPTVEATQ